MTSHLSVLRSGVATVAALGLAAALAGCGGAGTEPPAPIEGTPSPVASRAAAVSAPPAKAQGGDQAPAQQVTPERVVNPKAVVDVVREEVQGGEAESGGSPLDYLWQSPDPKLVKDEPYTIEPPKGLPALLAYVPPSNPLTKAKIELGKQLYFDPRVSLDGTVSCATCHNPAKGWTDQMENSIGIDGQVGGRSAPSVLNTAYGKTMFWDGRAPSLEGQAQGPIQNPIEMGKQSYKEIIERLRKISGYREQFQKVFGTDVTLDGFAKAVAAFERTAALSGNSAYDKYNGGDLAALTDSQKRGMVLFGLRLNQDDEFKTDAVLKKADCTSCHVGFNFTDEQFHNLGVGWDEKAKKMKDPGRLAIDAIGAKNPANYGAFKTPTVRDITNTAPYMHDGSLKTLEEVVEHYNKGGNPNPALDKDIRKLNLTDQEKKDVVEFMKALAGTGPKVELPTLPVGPDGKAPNSASALSAPKPKTALETSIPHGPLATR
jgi:cytochrome c peroxidase